MFLFSDFIDLSRPTKRGTIIPGKTTMSRNGNVGRNSVLLILIVYDYN